MADFSRKDLEALICDLAGVTSVTPLITKHINDLCIQYQMTWKEIARCLTWYVEVAKGEIKVQYGIKTICTSVREKANKYFEKLALDQRKQTQEAEKIVEYQANNIIFHISSLENQTRKPKLLDVSSIVVDEGEKDEQ